MLASMIYPGGKNGAGIYQKIINLMPPHEVYIEPFAGSGAVMRMKKPAAVNIAVDLVAPSKLPMLQEFVESQPAGEWHLIQGDGIEYIRKTRRPALIYCDPPYLMETRSGRRLYEFEMSAIAHRRFLRVVMASPHRVMISGYWSEMYANTLKDWNSISFEAMTRGGRTATEFLWFNFPVPLELHDYRFLGENFRERERIKRKKTRWTERLKKMPALERQALLSAIADSATPGEASSRTTAPEKLSCA